MLTTGPRPVPRQSSRSREIAPADATSSRFGFGPFCWSWSLRTTCFTFLDETESEAQQLSILITHEDIAMRTHLISEARRNSGASPNQDSDWYHAERELSEESRSFAESKRAARWMRTVAS